MSKPFIPKAKVCPKCGKEDFRMQSGFHFLGRHQFKCNHCGYEFASPEEVDRVTSSHKEQRTYTSDTKHTNRNRGSFFGAIEGNLAPKKRRGHHKKLW